MPRQPHTTNPNGANHRGAAKHTAGTKPLPRDGIPGSYHDVKTACHAWLLTHDRAYACAHQSGSHPW